MEDVSVTKAMTVTSKSTALLVDSDGGQFGSNVTVSQKGVSSVVRFNNIVGPVAWIHGKLTVNGGSGQDTLTLADGTVTGKVTANFNAGSSQGTMILDTMTCQSDVTLQSKEATSQLEMNDSVISGNLSHQNTAGVGNLVVTSYSTVGKAMTLKTSKGNATATIDSLSVVGKTTISAGATVSATWGSASQNSSLGGLVSITGKTGFGYLDLSYATLTSGISIGLGKGDTTCLLTSMAVGGTIVYKGGIGVDTATLTAITVTGTSSFVTGAGNDTLVANNSVFTKKVTVNTGDGNDQVGFQTIAGTNTYLNGGLSLLCGKGDDQAGLGLASIDGQRVHLGVASKADGGPGSNGGRVYLDSTSAHLTINNFDA
jgi:hypothetical protein